MINRIKRMIVAPLNLIGSIKKNILLNLGKDKYKKKQNLSVVLKNKYLNSFKKQHNSKKTYLTK
jgi:hypothetical protein